MPEPKTFWVARDPWHNILWLHMERPTFYDVAGWCSNASGGGVTPAFYASVGIPQEPAPGECWEVTHETIEGFVDAKMEKLHTSTARNVTEELKKRTYG